MSSAEVTSFRQSLARRSSRFAAAMSSAATSLPASSTSFHAAHERAGLTLVEVYTRGREFEDLYTLAEQLIEFDERVIVWRVRHFKVVQRVIGADVIGTQGTPVEVLGKLIHKRFFRDLWEVRNELTAMSLGEE